MLPPFQFQVQPVDSAPFFDYATWSSQRAAASFQEAAPVLS